MSASKTKTSKARSGHSAAAVNGAETAVLTLAEAAAYLRVSLAELAPLAERGQVPGRKIGGEWRFYKPALQHWLSDSKKNGLLSQIGALTNDPHMEEMLVEIYRRRGRSETEEG